MHLFQFFVYELYVMVSCNVFDWIKIDDWCGSSSPLCVCVCLLRMWNWRIWARGPAWHRSPHLRPYLQWSHRVTVLSSSVVLHGRRRRGRKPWKPKRSRQKKTDYAESRTNYGKEPSILGSCYYRLSRRWLETKRTEGCSVFTWGTRVCCIFVQLN